MMHEAHIYNKQHRSEGCVTGEFCFLVLGKFEEKCKGKKIERKSKRKEKVKENKKWS